MRFFLVSFICKVGLGHTMQSSVGFVNENLFHPTRQAFKDFINQTFETDSAWEIKITGLYEFKSREDFDAYHSS